MCIPYLTSPHLPVRRPSAPFIVETLPSRFHTEFASGSNQIFTVPTATTLTKSMTMRKTAEHRRRNTATANTSSNPTNANSKSTTTISAMSTHDFSLPAFSASPAQQQMPAQAQVQAQADEQTGVSPTYTTQQLLQMYHVLADSGQLTIDKEAAVGNSARASELKQPVSVSTLNSKYPISDETRSVSASASASASVAAPLDTISPDATNWYYIDLSGAQQGPFDSATMQQWYLSNLLTASLSVRRDGETSWITISDLWKKCNSYPNYDPQLAPFNQPLPRTISPISMPMPIAMPTAISGVGAGAGAIAGAGGVARPKLSSFNSASSSSMFANNGFFNSTAALSGDNNTAVNSPSLLHATLTNTAGSGLNTPLETHTPLDSRSNSTYGNPTSSIIGHTNGNVNVHAESMIHGLSLGGNGGIVPDITATSLMHSASTSAVTPVDSINMNTMNAFGNHSMGHFGGMDISGMNGINPMNGMNMNMNMNTNMNMNAFGNLNGMNNMLNMTDLNNMNNINNMSNMSNLFNNVNNLSPFANNSLNPLDQLNQPMMGMMNPLNPLTHMNGLDSRSNSTQLQQPQAKAQVPVTSGAVNTETKKQAPAPAPTSLQTAKSEQSVEPTGVPVVEPKSVVNVQSKKEVKEVREPRGTKAASQSKEVKQVKESKESKESKEPKGQETKANLLSLNLKNQEALVEAYNLTKHMRQLHIEKHQKLMLEKQQILDELKRRDAEEAERDLLKKEPTPVEKESSTQSTPTTGSSGLKAVPAPWASVAKPVKPAKTLQEIQNEEKLKKQRELEERRKMEESDRLLASRLALAETAAFRSPSPASTPLPTISVNKKRVISLAALNESKPATASWATETPNIPTKSIDEIKKEELELAKRKQEALAAERQQKTIAEAIANQKKSFASTISSENVNVVDSSSQWTIVNKKEKPKAPISTTPIPAVTPVIKRAVSTPTYTAPALPKPVVQTSFPPPVIEFLGWGRAQLTGLYPNVNKEDVLNIMMQLPLGAEGQEIIADTIYSNSSTMDGRRFASEFMKKRSRIEDTIKRRAWAFDWSEALDGTKHMKVSATSSSSSDANASAGFDDDWEGAFTVVNRKKNRK